MGGVPSGTGVPWGAAWAKRARLRVMRIVVGCMIVVDEVVLLSG